MSGAVPLSDGGLSGTLKLVGRALVFGDVFYACCRCSSGVERTLGKGEAESSILSNGTMFFVCRPALGAFIIQPIIDQPKYMWVCDDIQMLGPWNNVSGRMGKYVGKFFGMHNLVLFANNDDAVVLHAFYIFSARQAGVVRHIQVVTVGQRFCAIPKCAWFVETNDRQVVQGSDAQHV